MKLETIDLGTVLALIIVIILVINGVFDWKMLLLFALTTLKVPLKIRG